MTYSPERPLGLEVIANVPLPDDADSIRLLYLRPAARNDDRIECSLRVVKLSEKPQFVALSYVWGAPAIGSHVISCNNIPTPVTENCWDALHHLQRDADCSDPGRNKDGSILMWIDAICINQRDETEKLHQIKLMGDIFSKATSVCLWLGKGDEKSDQAISYLRVAGFQDLLDPIGKHRYRITRSAYFRAFWRTFFSRYLEVVQILWNHPGRAREVWREAIGSGVSMYDQTVSGRNVLQLLGREWTTRIWTLQEAVLNENPWILCGSKRLAWRCILHDVAFMSLHRVTDNRFLSWLSLVTIWARIHLGNERSKSSRKSSVLSQQPFQSIKATQTIPVIKILLLADEFKYVVLALYCTLLFSWKLDWTLSPTLHFFLGLVTFSLLLSFVGGAKERFEGLELSNRESILLHPTGAAVHELLRRRCSDPQDKSHGAREVLGRLDINLPEMKSSEQLPDVFRTLTAAVLSRTGTLNVLLWAGDTPVPRHDKHRSWVLDWTRDTREVWVDENYLRSPDLPYLHRSTLHSQPVWSIRGPQVLLVFGYRIGQIIWTSRELEMTQEVFQEWESPKHIHNICVIQNFIYRNSITAGNVQYLVRSCVLGDENNKENTKPLATDTFKKWLALLQAHCGLPASKTLALLGRHKLMAFHIRVCNKFAATRRKLCTVYGEHVRMEGGFRKRTPETHNKPSWGNSPTHAMVGDLVCLVSGVYLPLLLRPVRNGEVSELLGFVEFENQHVMRGELWGRLTSRSSSKELETFSLV
ncbi:putative Heterokaryon incompatibility domain-containing protein [Seiridium unicorne]|uniref:Heterokaryon incompatibility domain-containing protein n=1 Tax=Seiridium unicorne TaxID=138068 RepID=A0ABR2VCA7_9PEZI